MNLVKLNSGNFEKEVLEAEKPVLVDFWAPWCGPCLVLGPIIEDLAEELGEEVKVAKLNVDENQQLAVEYEVRGIPTIIVFKNGQPQQRLVGIQPREEYKKAVK
jgi:thioredoxin 1